MGLVDHPVEQLDHFSVYQNTPYLHFYCPLNHNHYPMKLPHYLTCMLAIALAMPATAQNWEATTTYTVQFNVPEDADWIFNQYSEASTDQSAASITQFCSTLYNSSVAGTPKAFAQTMLGNVDYEQPMLATDAHKAVYQSDMAKEMKASDCVGFTVFQDCYYNRKSNQFNTTNFILSPLFKVLDKAGTLKGYRNFAYPNCNGGQVPPQTVDQLCANKQASTADVSWGERMQYHFRLNTEGTFELSKSVLAHPLKRISETSLARDLFQRVKDGTLTAYADEACTQKLSAAELADRLKVELASWAKNPATGEMEETKTESEVEPWNIVSLRMRQHWQFDASSYALTSTIGAVAPMQAITDPATNTVLATKPIFWIKTS